MTTTGTSQCPYCRLIFGSVNEYDEHVCPKLEPTTATPKKVLVLHIEVPGVWADDLDEHAALLANGTPDAEDYRMLLTEDWMREQVGLTIVTWPSEKSQNHEFEVHSYVGRIVGGEARDRG